MTLQCADDSLKSAHGCRKRAVCCVAACSWGQIGPENHTRKSGFYRQNNRNLVGKKTVHFVKRKTHFEWRSASLRVGPKHTQSPFLVEPGIRQPVWPLFDLTRWVGGVGTVANICSLGAKNDLRGALAGCLLLLRFYQEFCALDVHVTKAPPPECPPHLKRHWASPKRSLFSRLWADHWQLPVFNQHICLSQLRVLDVAASSWRHLSSLFAECVCVCVFARTHTRRLMWV